MSEITLKAEEARGAAADMQKAADAAQQQFTSTRARLTELANSFKGSTATAFDAKFEEWRTSSQTLLNALTELGKFLRNAADTIEETDKQLASGLNG